MSELTIPYAGRAAVELTVSLSIAHVCPVVKERDFGTLTLTYKPATRILELHALAGYLRSFADRVITHEELTAELSATLSAELSAELFSIATDWTTAGVSYRVAA